MWFYIWLPWNNIGAVDCCVFRPGFNEQERCVRLNIYAIVPLNIKLNGLVWSHGSLVKYGYVT